MYFEHLVAVNDPGVVFLTTLSRAQVWSGLMRRVEDARPFLPGLEACSIVGRGEGWVERRLNFGAVQLSDRASFVADHWVCFETAPSEMHGGGRLTIAIEEPEPARLFLRFTYETAHAVGTEKEDAAYESFLRQAYEAADIDTVQVIRLLAAAPETPN
jgi:hypothetical protein